MYKKEIHPIVKVIEPGYLILNRFTAACWPLVKSVGVRRAMF